MPCQRELAVEIAFKENCPDVRNTKVVDLVRELELYRCRVSVHDPWVNAEEAHDEYGITLVEGPDAGGYDAVVLAVAHRDFVELGAAGVKRFGAPNHVVYDIKSVLPKDQVDARL